MILMHVQVWVPLFSCNSNCAGKSQEAIFKIYLAFDPNSFLGFFHLDPSWSFLMIFLLNWLWTPVQTNRALGLRGTRGNFGITSPGPDPFGEPREAGSVPDHRGLAIPWWLKQPFLEESMNVKAKKLECPMLEYGYRIEQSLLTSLSLT